MLLHKGKVGFIHRHCGGYVGLNKAEELSVDSLVRVFHMLKYIVKFPKYIYIYIFAKLNLTS